MPLNDSHLSLIRRGITASVYRAAGLGYGISVHNPVLCSRLMDHVRSLGFHTGRVTYYDTKWQSICVCLDTIDSQTGDSYTVRASIRDEYEAMVKLLEAVGVDLMDG